LTNDQISHLVSRVYATEQTELDCDEVQELLPAYVEALAVDSKYAALEAIQTHLLQCSDCNESFTALRQLAALEEVNGLPEVDELLASWSTDLELDSESSTTTGSRTAATRS
jgi:hypothetical protein